MGRPARHRIVCLSSQRWDDGMWTNKQHIMSRLSREHDVYYVSFGSRPMLRVLTDRTGSGSPIARIMNPRVRRHEELTVLDFWSPSVTHALGHGNGLRALADFDLRVKLVKRFLRERRVEDAIIWVYHPGYGALPAGLDHELVVYDCVDEYTAFPEFRRSAAWIAQRERELCGVADVVFCTARSLYEAKRGLNPHTYLVHNVGDAEHFNQALEPGLAVPEDIARLPRPIIGFVGAVSDYKLDTDWLLHLSRARPDWSIVVVGPVGLADRDTDVSRLEAAPNVHLLGHRAYAGLPAYLKGFDVAVIPYRINDYTRSVFPIKFFEFLASGRPVVISKLPALAEYYDSVLVASNAEEFVSRCDAALSDTEAARAARIELASHHTWAERIRQLMSHVEERLADQSRSPRRARER